MKKYLLIITILAYKLALAQDANILERNWFAFSASIDVTKYQGMKFILESDMKINLTKDSSGKAGMWARIDKEKGYGFFDNMYDRPVTLDKWKTYKIEGKIDSGAYRLVFGGISYFNGDFFCDNFKLKIQTKDSWQNINIKNGNFEANTFEGWNTGIGKNPFKIKGYSLLLEKDKKLANTFIKVKGDSIATYGINKEIGKYFETNGVKLYYEIYGTGEPLLLLHGNGQSIDAFENQIPFFKNKYKVIIPDCRGRGKSTDNNIELTYDIQASDMNNFLDYLKIDSANVIGWSDGGIIGLLMAKDYPKKVKKLIASGANVQQDTLAYFPIDYQRFLTQLADTTFKGIDRKLINLMVQYPSVPFEDLRKIKCPTLIVAGDNDEIRIGHTVKIFESIKNAQLFIVPKTSHYVLSQNYKVFNEAALKFLKEKLFPHTPNSN
jgi:pimeloyl-ACP methyl ester carboxylesterase